MNAGYVFRASTLHPTTCKLVFDCNFASVNLIATQPFFFLSDIVVTKKTPTVIAQVEAETRSFTCLLPLLVHQYWKPLCSQWRLCRIPQLKWRWVHLPLKSMQKDTGKSHLWGASCIARHTQPPYSNLLL